MRISREPPTDLPMRLLKPILVTVCSLWVAASAPAEITQVVSWGGNEYGQCEVPNDLTNAVAVSAGAFHSLALRADGTVVAWGSVGHGGTVPAGLSNVVSVSAGYFHNLAVKADGTAVGWGSNS